MSILGPVKALNSKEFGAFLFYEQSLPMHSLQKFEKIIILFLESLHPMRYDSNKVYLVDG